MADSVYEVMVKIGSDTEKFGQNIDKLETKMSKFGSGIKKLAGVIGAAFAVGQIKNAIVDLTEATMAQEKAEKRLETLAKNVPGTTEAQITALKQLAAAQQNLTTIGDEVTIAGQSQLATFQLSADTIAKLTPAFQDLAVGTYGANVSQEQMIQSGNLLGKVMMGQVGALSRVGVSFSEAQAAILQTGSESEKAATLVEVLGQNFGGLAQSMRNTREGQIIAMQNAWGDMKEVLGAYILPILGNLASWFSTKIPVIQSTLETLFKTISSITKPIIDFILPKLKNAFENVNFSIKPIIEKTMPVLKDVFNFITTKIFPPLIKVFEFMYTKVVPAFGDVFAENMPKIMGIMQNLWGIIKVVLDNILKGFEFAWPAISKVVEIAINIIKPLIGGIVDVLWGITDFIFGVFTGQWSRAWEGVKKIFVGVWDGIKGSMKAVVNGIIDGINVMIRGLNRLNFSIPDWVPGLGGKGFDLNIPQIPNFQGGVKDFPGGLARINERGGEIVNLPNGANVIPHDISMQIASAIGKAMGNNNQSVNVNLILDGKVLTTVTSKLQAQSNLGKSRALGVVAT